MKNRARHTRVTPPKREPFGIISIDAMLRDMADVERRIAGNRRTRRRARCDLWRLMNYGMPREQRRRVTDADVLAFSRGTLHASPATVEALLAGAKADGTTATLPHGMRLVSSPYCPPNLLICISGESMAFQKFKL